MNHLLQKYRLPLKSNTLLVNYKHYALSFLLFALSFQLTKAQNISLSNYDGRAEITTSNGYIHLTNGFHIAQGKTAHIYITGTPNTPPAFLNPSAPNVTTNLSAANNYIASWTATAPDGDPNHLVTRPLKDAKLTIQYFDGLGRPLQTVAKQGSLETATGNSGDIVTPIVYDAFGREATRYLPYVASTTGDGSYKSTATGDQVSYYNNTPLLTGQSESGNYAQSQIVYEASPLNRVLKTMAPGSSWVGANVGVGQGYWTNTATDNVQYWTVSFITPGSGFGAYTQPTAYQPGTLYKNIATDENNHQVIEFKDKEGHIVLKKVQLDNSVTDNGTGSSHDGWLCTYYLYDDLGNLRCVVQPEGVKSLSQSSWDLTNSTILAEQCFRYEYDQRNRIIIKQVPGAQPVYMVYDNIDRLVMTQDGNMRTQNNWLVIQYDNLNRPIKTGLLNDASNNFTTQLSNAYSSTSYPSSLGTQLTETHYDDYTNLPALNGSYKNDWDSQFMATDNTNYPYPQMPNPISTNTTVTTQGLVTWTKTAVLKTDGSVGNFLATVNIYDDKARVIQTQSQNINGGVDVTTTQYTWTGQPLITVQKTENPKVTGDEVLTIVSKMTYDDLGRVVKTEKKQGSSLSQVNSGAMTNYITLSTMQYDGLGQLKKKILEPSYVGGANEGLENLNYDYNIRGWLLGVNRAYVSDANSTNNTGTISSGISGEAFTDPGAPAYSYGSNFFGFDLGYDKTNNNLINGQTYTNKQLNGNIAGMVWKSNSDGVIRKYDFSYDNVNRLLKADYNQYNGSGFDKTSAGIDYSMYMGTNGTDPTSAYDGNGNILRMNQMGYIPGVGTKQIDALVYSYTSGSNKLAKVTDQSIPYLWPDGTKGNDFQDGTNTDDDYAYDANGNLIQDKNKGILISGSTPGIQYNYLNLPRQINVNGKGTISYIYDAGGSKLQKITTEGTKTTTTTYIGGIVYQQSSLNNTQVSDTLQFFSTEEGRCRVSNNKFAYDYFLKDHLGNTRMVLTDDYNASSPILEATSYYPFGLTQKGIGLEQSGSLTNKYKYNGKELQSDLGLDQYDYGARFYDAQLGRFHQPDPSSDKWNMYSTYNYTFNNPINIIDPDGRDGIVTGSGTKDDPYVIKANYYYSGLDKDQIAGVNSAIADYNNGGKATSFKTDDGDIYVKFDLSAKDAGSMDEATKMAGQDTKTVGDHVFHYGNIIKTGTVDATQETLNPLGSANNSTITLDKDKIKATATKAPGPSLSDVYAGVVKHEIGHNLGGNHGDPGSIMIQVNATERSNPNTIGNSGTGVYDYSLPNVNKNGIRAIMGRVQNTSTPESQTFNIKESRYLSAKENSRVTSTTSGKITLIK